MLERFTRSTSTGNAEAMVMIPRCPFDCIRMAPAPAQVYDHNSRDVMISLGIRSLPTFHFYANGSKVDECRGASIRSVEQRVDLHRGSGR